MSFFNSLFGGGTSTSTYTPDKGTQDWAKYFRNTAQGYAGQNLGLPSSFGAADISRYMDPYTQSVIQGMNPMWDQQRAAAMQSGADQAVAAGAYGGSRSGILQAQLMGGVNQNQAAQTAQLLSSGYSQALAQLNQDRGFGLTRDQSIFNILNGGFQGGGYTMTQQQPMNIMGGLLGMGATGLGFGGLFSNGGGAGGVGQGFLAGSGLQNLQPTVTPSTVSRGY